MWGELRGRKVREPTQLVTFFGASSLPAPAHPSSYAPGWPWTRPAIRFVLPAPAPWSSTARVAGAGSTPDSPDPDDISACGPCPGPTLQKDSP